MGGEEPSFTASDMETNIALMAISLEAPQKKKLKIELPCDPAAHFRENAQRTPYSSAAIFTHPCLIAALFYKTTKWNQHDHQLMDGKWKCIIHTKWNIIQL